MNRTISTLEPRTTYPHTVYIVAYSTQAVQYSRINSSTCLAIHCKVEPFLLSVIYLSMLLFTLNRNLFYR